MGPVSQRHESLANRPVPLLSTLDVSGYELELIQRALRVGKGLLARARIGDAISDPSPRDSRLKCLYLLRRYLAKFRLCRSDRVRRWLTIHGGCRAFARRLPGSGIRFKLRVELGL
jgi:hypothetical protein